MVRTSPTASPFSLVTTFKFILFHSLWRELPCGLIHDCTQPFRRDNLPLLHPAHPFISVCLSISQSIHLFYYLSIYLSFYLSIYLSLYLSSPLSIYVLPSLYLLPTYCPYTVALSLCMKKIDVTIYLPFICLYLYTLYLSGCQSVYNLSILVYLYI